MKKTRFYFLIIIGILASAVSYANYDGSGVLRPECIVDVECPWGMLCIKQFCKVQHEDIFGVPDKEESEDAFIQRTLGCSGGAKMCFAGTVSYNGTKIKGVWYKN